MADEKIEEEQKEGEEENKEPTAADKLIEEVREKLAKSSVTPPEPKPVVDQTKAVNDYRETMKKQMGWNDSQFDTYQRDKVTAQAPLVSELSKNQVREAHKDFDSLKDAYEVEYKKYTDQGVAVGKDLAEQIFWMVKGREVDAGRYKAPDSQPVKKPIPSGGKSPERISRSYDPSSPGLGGGKADAGEEVQLTDEEKSYAKLTGVTPEDYANMREEKRSGKRQITEVTFRVPKVDGNSSPADRDLAALAGRHDMKRI